MGGRVKKNSRIEMKGQRKKGKINARIRLKERYEFMGQIVNRNKKEKRPSTHAIRYNLEDCVNN